MRTIASAFFLFAGFFPLAFAQVQNKAPVTTSPVSTTGYLLQGIFGLFVILLLMWGAWWLVKRTGFNRAISGIRMKVVGGLAIGNRERIMVVEIGDTWLVLGVTSTQINTLATLPKQEIDAVTGESTAIPFAAWLKKTIDRKNDKED